MKVFKRIFFFRFLIYGIIDRYYNKENRMNIQQLRYVVWLPIVVTLREAAEKCMSQPSCSVLSGDLEKELGF